MGDEEGSLKDFGTEEEAKALLGDDEPVEFPEVLCGKIAGITDGFSFAYMQEAFLACLLAIANRRQAGLRRDGQDQVDVEVDAAVEILGEQWEMLDLDGRVVDGQKKKKKQKKGGHGHEHNGEKDGDGKKDELDKYELWVEMKKQVANLRREMGKDKERE